MKVVILGCGGVGANAAQQLMARNPALECVVADLNLTTAENLALIIGRKARALKLDVTDPASLDSALNGAKLVLNTAGPFYRNGMPVIEAAIRNKVDYIDVNDDDDFAEKLFYRSDVDRRAKEAGIKLIIGCGFAPGMTNVMAGHAAKRLDRVDAIRITLAVPFVPMLFSPAVLEHMFHITGRDVAQKLDGELQMLKGWGGKRETTFLAPFSTHSAYYFGHSETVTLAHFIPEAKEVTNRLAFFPESGAEKWRTLLEQGFGSMEKLPGLNVSPARYLQEHLKSEAAQGYFAHDRSAGPAGYANQIEVEGMRGTESVVLRYEVHGGLRGNAAEPALELDATPTCARIGMERFLSGEVLGEGLLAPEVGFEAESFMRDVLKDSRLTLNETEIITRRNV